MQLAGPCCIRLIVSKMPTKASNQCPFACRSCSLRHCSKADACATFLEIAVRVCQQFADQCVAAGVHWWYHTPSHAAELTAGYFNTSTRNGYTLLASTCAAFGASLVLTCVEMADAQHPPAAACGPQALLKQVRATAYASSVPMSGVLDQLHLVRESAQAASALSSSAAACADCMSHSEGLHHTCGLKTLCSARHSCWSA